MPDWTLMSTGTGREGTIQQWEAPVYGRYLIAAYGAQGGGTGGRGARVAGEFTLMEGLRLSVLVGQKPAADSNGSGGGGGTFVVAPENDPLLVAGGGGGSRNRANTPFEWMHGQAGPAGAGAQNIGGAGGVEGNGGVGGSEGAGGGGFLTNGGDSDGRIGGASYLNGGLGGISSNNGPGGYGGGGAAWDSTGGGGGWSGGGGGDWASGGPNGDSYNFGGGGGSFNAGDNPTADTGFQSGDGLVEITLLEELPLPEVDDWSKLVPQERQTVYVIDVGDYRMPISSVQSTMRRAGQSYLQAIVPNGGDHAEMLNTLLGESMVLRGGFRYADGSLSPLEDIATAPLQILRRDQGPFRDTLTISGYGARAAATAARRPLRNVQTRSSGTDGRRRVRCDIDLFLRPGHTAIDSDGAEFVVGIIQYFISAQTEAMEVLQDG